MRDSSPDHTKQQNNLPPGQRPAGNEQERRGQGSPGAGEPSPGLKDKEAPTSDSYGDTRDSGEGASR